MILNTSVLLGQKGDPRITACAYDAAEYKNAEDYCNMYLELLCADRRYIEQAPKFYIKNLVKAMEKIPRKKREKLEKFFALNGGIQHYVKVNIKLIKKYKIELIKKFNIVFPENAIIQLHFLECFIFYFLLLLIYLLNDKMVL